MVQTYKNCNNHPIKVGAGCMDASGRITVRSDSRREIASGGVEWNHPRTVAGFNYHTVLCCP
jgi:hypothetical protein